MNEIDFRSSAEGIDIVFVSSSGAVVECSLLNPYFILNHSLVYPLVDRLFI